MEVLYHLSISSVSVSVPAEQSLASHCAPAIWVTSSLNQRISSQLSPDTRRFLTHHFRFLGLFFKLYIGQLYESSIHTES